MIFRGKRADGIISFLFSALFGIILAAFFIIAVFMKVKSAAEDSTFHKRFYSRDLALMIDSMHAANGNAIITYEVRYPGFMDLETILEYDRASLTDADKIIIGKKTPTSFLFGHNDQINITPSTVNGSTPSFNIILRDNEIKLYTGIKQDVLPVEVQAEE